MSKEKFYKERDKQLVGDLQPCYHCNPPKTNFKSYMEKVDHREKVHGIPRGKADDYKITGGDPHWVDEEENQRMREQITNDKLKFQDDVTKKLVIERLFPNEG